MHQFKFSFYFILKYICLQCCVNLGCIARWFSYTCTFIHSFPDSFPMFLLQNNEQTSLCYTVCPFHFIDLLYCFLYLYFICFSFDCYDFFPTSTWVLFVLLSLVALGVRLCCAGLSHSVLSDSLQLHELQPAKFLILGIFHARILKWVAISSFRGSS